MAAVPVSAWQPAHKLPLNRVLPLAMLPELPELELDELLELEELLLELELDEELLELEEELDELEDELEELEEDELLEELPVPPHAVSSNASESATVRPRLPVNG